MDHLNRSGVGLTVVPAEAHWLMGFGESAIGAAKRTVGRLIREGSKLEIPELYMMAAAAMNSHVGPSGFSAYQWAFGSGGGVLDDQQLLKGISPQHAFDKLVKDALPMNENERKNALARGEPIPTWTARDGLEAESSSREDQGQLDWSCSTWKAQLHGLSQEQP